MAWYSGGIAEAIAESRAKHRLFVVYITGQDEASQKMDKLWDNSRVQELCNSSCVALKLDAQSDGSRQFAAIYPVLCVPSAFFINNRGEILDALAIMSDESEFLEKVETVIKKFQNASPESSGATGTPSTSNDGATSSTGASDMPVQSSKTEDEMKEEVNRLQEKIQQKRQQDTEKKKQDERKKEIERRELGRNIQKLKEAQQEAKLKREIEERRKNKIEEREARERVKRQIEQDKRDRAARIEQEKQARDEASAARVQNQMEQGTQERAGRFKQEKGQQEELLTRRRLAKEEEVEAERAREARERSSHARLQFRMPDGSTFSHQFDATDTLQAAYNLVQQNGQFAPHKFTLSIAFPRRVFADSDLVLSFRELALVPSASLIVLPYAGGATSTETGSSVVAQLFSFLLFLVMLPIQLLQYLWSFIAGPAPAHTHAQTSATSPSQPPPQRGAQQRDSGASMDPSRKGNMTRLRDVKRGDEDEATWNGNSTQQL